MSFLTIDALALSGLFGASAVLHLAGPRFLRVLYRRWRFPAKTHLVVGVLELLAALFLSNPITRIWGVLLAGFISLAAAITLLNHGKYAHSVPVMLLMVALVPASLAGPLGS